MKNLFLAWTIIGTVLPILFFLGLFHGQAVGVADSIAVLFANSVVGGFTVDIVIASLAFWTFMYADRSGPQPWLFIVLNLCIGLSCALPAYFYRRTVLQDG